MTRRFRAANSWARAKASATFRGVHRVAALLSLLVSACGGLESERADPGPREPHELEARQWHDRVVRLEGEATRAAERGDECPPTCAIAHRAHELAAQICDLARSDAADEGTAVLCEDAEARAARARSAIATRCECGAPAAD